jgi:hypothetical protein
VETRTHTTRKSVVCPWPQITFVPNIFALGINVDICTEWGMRALARPYVSHICTGVSLPSTNKPHLYRIVSCPDTNVMASHLYQGVKWVGTNVAHIYIRQHNHQVQIAPPALASLSLSSSPYPLLLSSSLPLILLYFISLSHMQGRRDQGAPRPARGAWARPAGYARPGVA